MLYPLGRAIWLGQQRCDAQGDNCRSNGWDQYVDVFRSNEFQHAVVGHVQVRPDHGAARARARRRPGRARRQVPARHRRVPGDLLLDGRHVGRRGQPDVVFLLAARVGVLANVGWFERPVPRRQAARAAARPGHGAAVGRRVERLGRASGSRSSSSPPACRASRATCTRRRSSTAPAASDASGAITLPLLGPTLLFVVIVLTDAGVPGLRRDRPAHRRRPAAEDSTTTLTYLIYGSDVDHQQQRRAAGRGRGAAVRRAARSVGAPARAASAGGCTMAESPTRRLETAAAASARSAATCCSAASPLVVLFPDLHDGDRRAEARRRGARQPAAARRRSRSTCSATRGPRAISAATCSTRSSSPSSSRSPRSSRRCSRRTRSRCSTSPDATLLFGVFLATLLVPLEATLVVNRRTVDSLGWLNSYQGLIVPFLATAFGDVPRAPGVHDAAPRPARRRAHRRRRPPRVPPPRRHPARAPDARRARRCSASSARWNQYLWPNLITTEEDMNTVQSGLRQLRRRQPRRAQPA